MLACSLLSRKCYKVTIKRVFQQKEKKKKLTEPACDSNLDFSVLISPGGKTLNSCTTQALRETMGEKWFALTLLIYSIFFFLFSWEDIEHRQINNRAVFLYLIQDRKCWNSGTLEEKKNSRQRSHFSIVLNQALQLCISFITQDDLRSIITHRLPVLLNRGAIKLVIIDSIAALFRVEYSIGETSKRAKILRSFGAQLHKLSHLYAIPIVCVNQVRVCLW